MPCRFDSDQTFTEIEATRLETMSVIDGTWYIYLKGDYAGRVSGNVYDIRNQTNPILLVTDVSINCLWAACLRHSPRQEMLNATGCRAVEPPDAADQPRGRPPIPHQHCVAKLRNRSRHDLWRGLSKARVQHWQQEMPGCTDTETVQLSSAPARQLVQFAAPLLSLWQPPWAPGISGSLTRLFACCCLSLQRAVGHCAACSQHMCPFDHAICTGGRWI